MLLLVCRAICPSNAASSETLMNLQSVLIRYFCLLGIVVIAHQARATLLVYEPFDYPAGQDLFAKAGGAGFAAAWGGSSACTTQSGSLETSTYQGTGNSVSYVRTYGQSNSRTLASTYGTTGTDLWISFLIRPNAVNAWSGVDFGPLVGGLHVGILGGPSGQGPPSANWGMDSHGAGPVQSQVPVTYGQTTLLVVNMTCLASNDRFDLYVNPSGAAAHCNN